MALAFTFNKQGKKFLSSLFNKGMHHNIYDKYSANAKVIVNPLRKLDNVIDVEKVKVLKKETFADIWKNHFEKRPHVHGLCIRPSLYSQFKLKSANYSMFIIPIVSKSNIRNFLVQKVPTNSSNSTTQIIAITSLAEYQKHQSNAAVSVAAYFFEEMIQYKMDLIPSLIEFNGGDLNREETVGLVTNILNLFQSAEMISWIHKFNYSPDTFDFNPFLSSFIQFSTTTTN